MTGAAGVALARGGIAAAAGGGVFTVTRGVAAGGGALGSWGKATQAQASKGSSASASWAV